jgi:hypothetical protein
MGRFNDYLKNFASTNQHVAGAKRAYHEAGGATGAYNAAKGYAGAAAEEYRQVHNSMPGAREYMDSAAGRATARFAVGSSVQTFLQNKAKRLGKSGTITGAVGNALFTFAHTAFQSHMNNLKHDQRIFENVAKARRGSPELEHLTHNELREISDNAKRYGGPDAEHIHKTASGELDRRQARKNEEQAKGIEHKRGLLNEGKEARDARRHETQKARMADKHEQRRAQKEQSHQDKMRRQAELRNTAGHVDAKKTTENVARASAAAKAPAGGNGADVKKGGDKGPVRVLGKSRSGKSTKVMNAQGKTEYLGDKALAERKKPAGSPVMRRKGPTTQRERAPGAGRGGSRGRSR